MDARHDEDAGFTLTETIIAMVIFALVAVATAGVLIKSATLTKDNRGRAVASKLAMEQLDLVRGTAYAKILSSTKPVAGPAGITYTVSTLVTPVFIDSDGKKRSCSAGGVGGQLYKKVGVVVTWPNSSQVAPVREDTIVQYAGDIADGSKGALAVVVRDSGVGKAAPGPVAQQPVTLATGETAVTDDDGCAFFDGLTPTTTNRVTVARTGWVDSTSTSPATSEPGIAAGQVATSSISFDEATTFNLSFGPTGQPLGTYRVPTAAKYTVVPQLLSADLTKRKYQTLASTPGYSGSSQWWPEAAGYAVWLGGCTPSSPAEQTLVNDALPGAQITKVVPTGGLTATFAASSGARTLYLTNTSAAATCSGGATEQLSVPVTAGAASVKVALPFGSWKASWGTAPASTLLPTTLSAALPLQSVVVP
ncbi:type IV pilus modification PilV family protein [Kineococcus sp. SYSU DK001]|uniref:type IV pilus modification PilV family protein n=1 Tax=Kineococcus sp. SYSU DK001 TaxID=3383122 RepID=UPI003D7F0801